MMTAISQTLVDQYKFKPNGQYRGICPACSHLRKGANKSERVLSVRVELPDLKWMCHHCGERGGESIRQELPTNVVKFTPPPPSQLDRRVADFLHERGIGKEAQAGVVSATRYIRSAGETPCVWDSPITTAAISRMPSSGGV